MNKKRLWILYLILIIGTGIAVMLTSAAPTVRAHSDSSTRFNSDLQAAALHQAVDPTPTAEPVSKVGSTNGIMLMGVIIVMIILLPILLRKSTWKK